MKRKLWIAILVLLCVLVFAGCACEHEWVEADCDTPKTCALCEETEGAPLGHSWLAATCEDPKACEICGTTEGEAKGHLWAEATCTEAKKCNVCRLTEGEPLGHTWEEATTEVAKTCATCQETEGEPLDTDPRFTTESTKELQGTWSTDIVATGEMLQLAGYVDELECTLFYYFGNTGEGKAYIEFEDLFAVKDAIKKMTADVMYAEFAAMGMGQSAANESMVATYGMTVEEYVDASVEALNMEELFGAFFMDFFYYVEDGEIYCTYGDMVTGAGPSWEGDFESSEYTIENGILTMEEEYLDDPDVLLEWTRVEE